MLQWLCKLETICVDGTCQVCPAIFTQLFTINGFIIGQQFLLMYSLQPSKFRDDYNRFSSYLKEEAQNLGLQLNTNAVMADFELALVQSVELQFPGADIQGCFFHLSQWLWRRVQATYLYKNDPDTRWLIHKAFAFVPLDLWGWHGQALRQMLLAFLRLNSFFTTSTITSIRIQNQSSFGKMTQPPKESSKKSTPQPLWIHRDS